MNDNSSQQYEFILRRLADEAKVAGKDVDPRLWLAILIPLLIIGLGYVIWMYVRDGRVVGWPWATFLASLRYIVYLILGGVFLLPALQAWETSETRSKVIVVLDVSGSMYSIDEPPQPGVAQDQMPTRLDKVVRFLTSEKIAFLKRLQDTNPVVVYRFGGRLDEDFRLFEGGKVWTADQWNAWLQMDPKEYVLDGLSPEAREICANSPEFAVGPQVSLVTWANEWRNLEEDRAIPRQIREEERFRADQAKLVDKMKKLEKRLDTRQHLLSGTNLGDSLLALVNREGNNMVQGIVVISDGRSNQGSEQAFDEAANRARRAKVPIFTIPVGEYREPINIRITDLQAPEQAPPDEKFPVRVEVDGEGLPDKDVEVTLQIFRPKTDPKKDKPILEIRRTAKFNPNSQPPHAQIEFPIDPAERKEMQKQPSTGKPEFEEGDWKFIARVPKAKGETTKDKEHVSDVATVQIIKKPLRVLLFAGGPTHDFQFIKNMFVREVDKKRAELSIFLQVNTQGERALDVDQNRLLSSFPNTLHVEEDPREKPDAKYYNLAQYDLIIAFDPDWTQLSTEQLTLLQRWVSSNAGGLILVAGHVNTLPLSRAANAEKLKPLLDLYPVTLEDARLLGLGVERSTTEAWRLNFPGATAEMEFLKLEDETKDGQPSNEPLAGWEEFFTGQKRGEGGGTGAPLRRGFYNYYPVKSVKPTATVVATFTDPRARLADGKEQPYIVTMPFPKGKVVYIGSGELRRLRQYKELYFERFWTKLGRYAASGSQTKQNKRGAISMGSTYVAGTYIPISAQIFGPTLEPLPINSKPEAVLTPPAGVPAPPKVVLRPTSAEATGWFEGRVLLMQPGEYRVSIQIPGGGEPLSRKFIVKESNPEMDNVRPDLGQLYQIASDANDPQNGIFVRLDDDTKKKLRAVLKAPKAEQPAKAVATAGKETTPAAEKESYRLYFDLGTAELIPDLMIADLKKQRSRGPMEDLWDKGASLPGKFVWSALWIELVVLGILAVVFGIVTLLYWQSGKAMAVPAVALAIAVTLIVTSWVPMMLWGDIPLFDFNTMLSGAYTKPVQIAFLLPIVVGLLSIEWLTRKLLKLA